MADRDGRGVEATESSDPHLNAADAFADRVRESDIEGVENLILFGSTARDEAAGLESDIDVLVVVSDDVDRHVEDRLREIAYEILLEYGPVIELHVLTQSAFETRRSRGHPFVRNVLEDGRSYGYR